MSINTQVKCKGYSCFTSSPDLCQVSCVMGPGHDFYVVFQMFSVSFLNLLSLQNVALIPKELMLHIVLI